MMLKSLLAKSWVVGLVGVTLALLLVGGAAVGLRVSRDSGAARLAGSPAPAAAAAVADPAAVSPVGDDLVVQEPPANVSAPSAAAVKAFGELAARTGVAWAEAFAAQTAFLPSLWDGKAPTPASYSVLLPFMTETAKAKLLRQTGDPSVLAKDVIDALAIRPDRDPKIVWSVIPMRPDQNGYKILSTGVGPKSSYNGKPTLRVELNDFHTFDLSVDGKPTAENVGRHSVYLLAQTGDPSAPWLLDDWSSKIVDSVAATPRVAEK